MSGWDFESNFKNTLSFYLILKLNLKLFFILPLKTYVLNMNLTFHLTLKLKVKRLSWLGETQIWQLQNDFLNVKIFDNEINQF